MIVPYGLFICYLCSIAIIRTYISIYCSHLHIFLYILQFLSFKIIFFIDHLDAVSPLIAMQKIKINIKSREGEKKRMVKIGWINNDDIPLMKVGQVNQGWFWQEKTHTENSVTWQSVSYKNVNSRRKFTFYDFSSPFSCNPWAITKHTFLRCK